MSHRRPTVRTNRAPSYTERRPLTLRELPPPPQLSRSLLADGQNSYLRVYRLGECAVIVTKQYGRWHLSITGPDRLPTWDEVAEARYRILPAEITAAMILPPKDLYVNIHPNCFQLVEVAERQVDHVHGEARP